MSRRPVHISVVIRWILKNGWTPEQAWKDRQERLGNPVQRHLSQLERTATRK